MNIGQELETLAHSQPAAPAMHVPGRPSLTYADLGAQIRYVRERLDGWGIRSGEILAGVIPARPEMAVACATIPGLATFAPIGPGLPLKVYEELLGRLRPKALVVPRDLDNPVRAAARRYGVAELELTADPAAPAGMFTLDVARSDRSLRDAARSYPDIAYIVSTSGTTGRQKLVPLGHRRVIYRARVDGDWCGISANDVVCHIEPMHPAMGLQSLLTNALLRGSSLVCLPEHDIDGFLGSLDRYRPTWSTANFAVHRAILQRAAAFPEAVAQSRFRFMRSGSGAISPDEIDRIEQAFQAPLLIGFGLTETAVITCSPMPPRPRKRGSVGLCMTGEVAVMNEAGQLCSVGETGEIIARDPLVTTGYFEDPQLTSEAFVGDWFRTGDLGRFDEDGYYYVVGRIKQMINRGGEKIPPDEIDAAIESHPGIRAAAAFGIPHPTLGEEVVAAVVRSGDAVATEADIIEKVRQRVGPRRTPRRIYFVDDLPRTDNGKVRRSELPRLLRLDQPGAPAPAYAPPRDEVERSVCRIWTEVLGIARVGIDDNFFELGGHSLVAAHLFSRLAAELGRALPLAALLEAPTVRGLARFYRDGAGSVSYSALVPITAGGSLPPLFAVPGVFGNVVCFAGLARELGSAQPFYGLQSIGLDGALEPLDSIEQMAARYLLEVRQVQPHGPYRLLGACFGATVAYEMARQLSAAGEEVAFLGLLDPALLGGGEGEQPMVRLPAQLKRALSLGRFVHRRLHLYAAEMRGLGLEERARFVGGKLALVGASLRKRDVFRGDRREFDQRRVYDANRAALLRYKYRPLAAENTAIAIFRTDRRLGAPASDSQVDWAALAGQRATYDRMPGNDSGDMLRGVHARQVAIALHAKLADTRSKHESFPTTSGSPSIRLRS